MTILLVRHARAGRRDRWDGDDRQRPLSAKGWAQAERLPGVLAPWLDGTHPVLVSSPWTRCVETLEPLAAATGVAVATDEALGEGMVETAADALHQWLRPWPVVLCTHGDVIAHLLAGLASGGVDIDDEPRFAKGSVWVLAGAGAELDTARYLAPAPNSPTSPRGARD